jgi:PAS domain S-box-containing protein
VTPATLARGHLGTAAGWAGSYLAAGVLVAVSQPDLGPSPWYPSLAVGTGLLLLQGRRWWPLIAAVELVICWAQYRAALPAVGAAAVAVGEVVLVTTVLEWLRFRPRFSSLDDVVALVLAALVGTASGAMLGASIVGALGFEGGRWRDVAESWFVGDLTGLLVVLPFVLLVVVDPGDLRGRALHLGRLALTELAVVFVVGIGLTWGLFFALGREIGDAQPSPLVLVVLPVLVIAIRFGRLRTSLFTLVTTIVGTWAFVAGRGAEVVAGADLLGVQLFLGVVAVVGLTIAVAVHAERAARFSERALLDASPVAVVVLDRERRVEVWNAAAERIFGWTAEEVLGRRPPMVQPTDHEAFDRRAQEQLQGPTETTVRYCRRDGSTVDARLNTAPLRDGRGVVVGTVGIIEDVSDRLDAERERNLLAAAIDQATEAVIVVDATPAIVYANPAAVRDTGYELGELVGADPSILYDPGQPAAFYDGLMADLRAGLGWQGTLHSRRKDGTLVEHESILSSVLGTERQPIAFVAVLRDVTRERALERDLAREQLERREVAAVMAAAVPGPSPERTGMSLCEAVVRMGGIEWAGLLRQLPNQRLVSVAAVLGGHAAALQAPLGHGVSAVLYERAAEGPWAMDWRERPAEAVVNEAALGVGVTAVGGAPVTWDGRVVAVLVFGTSHPDGCAWLQQRLPALSQVAAHAAVLVGPQLHELDDRDAVRARIHDIVEHHRFHAVFQPVIDLAAGTVIGFEALTRFTDGSRPDLVFAEAHAVGLGRDLEAACLSVALADARDLPPSSWLSLNTTPSMVLGGALSHLLSGTDRRVVLEVTEHEQVEDYAELRRALAAVPGVRVSVDDAGAGYASLHHILELQPDLVKLDIGLVRGIETDPARQAMVAGMRHFAAETGTDLLAEGVETDAEADALRRLGVELAQGYLFGKPAPVPAGRTPDRARPTSTVGPRPGLR